MRTLLKILIVAASLGVATMLVDGIDVDTQSTTGAIATLLGVALVFGLVNAVLKPLIHVLGCACHGAPTFGRLRTVARARIRRGFWQCFSLACHRCRPAVTPLAALVSLCWPRGGPRR